MTPAELRAEMKARGMQVSHSVTSPKTGKTSRNFYNRKEMIALLEGAPLPAPAPVPAASAPVPPVPAPVPAGAVLSVPPAPASAGTSGAPAPAQVPENRTPAAASAAPAPAPAAKGPAANLVELARDWRMFLSEFQYTPQARFLNSVAAYQKPADAAEYVRNTFALVNSPFAADVAAKLESAEARDLLRRTVAVPVSKRINARFAVWYGEPGSGKTTAAQLELPEAEVVVCNAEMTPDDLFRGFYLAEEKDETGKIIATHPAFRRCPLRDAMENGKPVILDEINLLSLECLRALQTVTDGKSAVNINGERIEIRDGFRVLGTMNLNVADQVCPLPPPLVDRAFELRKFELKDEKLAEIAFA